VSIGKYCSLKFRRLETKDFLQRKLLQINDICNHTELKQIKLLYNANDGPVIIQYKCLVPIFVFSEMKLHGLAIFKTKL
jgi:hypothetical protein